MNTDETFNAALVKYVELVQRLNDEYLAKFYPNATRNLVTIDVGSRYIRVVKDNGTQRSVHSFVDKTNGDVLKGSWRAPVKNGVRGNIHKAEIPINHHGPNYLR